MKTLLVFLLILAIGWGVLAGCQALFGGFSYTYDNARQYAAGDCTLDDNVQHLNIDWLSGDVVIRYHDKDYIAVTEEAPRPLSKDATLHYWLDGTTLRIRYAGSDRRHLFPIPSKALTVYLPRDAALEGLAVETVSADIALGDITARWIDLETVSGAIEAEGVCCAEGLEADSVSGSITVYTQSDSSMLEAETTSGAIDVTAGALDSISLSSTSGRITAALRSLSYEGSLETLSGAIVLHLPEDGAFTGEASTVSGSFDSDLPYEKVGDAYRWGTGGAELDIETLSGSVSIRAAD